MILGFWDGQGAAFSDLMPGDASSQTDAVLQAIATGDDATAGTHYSDYALPLDSPGMVLNDKSSTDPGGCHPDDCVADFMRTSRSSMGLPYGWSVSSMTDEAFVGYVGSKYTTSHPACRQYAIDYDSDVDAAFALLQAEIMSGHPVGMEVDATGDGLVDHFVVAIGYDTTSSPWPMYACWDTWSHVVRWQYFVPVSIHGEFSVRSLWAMHPDDSTGPTVVASGWQGWHNHDVTVAFDGSDNTGGSGYWGVQWHPSGGADQEGPSVTIPAPSGESSRIECLWFRPIDRVGNYGEWQQVFVNIETVRPVTKAPRATTVRRGQVARLRFRIVDPPPCGSRATVTIRIRNAGGRIVKVLRLGKRWLESQSYGFRCTLPRGHYRFFVYAADAAGNKQKSVGSNRLTVR